VGTAGKGVEVIEGITGIVVGVLGRVGTVVSVSGTAVCVGATELLPPMASVRIICGATQVALSPEGDPFARTVRINLTLCPERGLRSISTGS